MKQQKHWLISILALFAGVANAAVLYEGNATNVVVNIAEPQHARNITLKPDQTLWIVAHTPFVYSFGYPPGDAKFWKPPPKLTVKASQDIFRHVFLVDGLTSQDKVGFNMAADDMPLQVYPADKPGKSDITIVITPNAPGKKQFSETLHVTVK